MFNYYHIQHMKKIIWIIAIIALSATAFAQDIGIGDIIYEDGSQTKTTTITENILPNNIAFETIKIHLRLTQLTSQINPEEESLATLKELQNLSKTDVIAWLSIATDKRQMLSDYLNQSNTAIQKGSTLISFLRQEISFLQLDMNACLVDKSIADKEYFDSINMYDQASSEKALATSIASDNCASQNRIQYNAKVYLLERIVFFTSILQQKYDLLFNEQETLINHFDVISDNMLQKLNLINDTLKQYQF